MVGDRDLETLGAGEFFLTRALPPALARWKPRERDDEERAKRNPPLPRASDRFWELETQKAFHCSPNEWEAMSEVRRAELIAHENEKNLREAYAMEERKPEPVLTGDGSRIAAFRKRAGLAPVNSK